MLGGWGLAGGCWKSLQTSGPRGSQGIGVHLCEGPGALVCARDEAWSHQRTRGLGMLEAQHISRGESIREAFAKASCIPYAWLLL